MILSKLYELYGRLALDPEFGDVLPRIGTSKQKMSFIVVLTPDGRLFDIQDAKEERPVAGKNGKQKNVLVARDLIVPGAAHPSGTAATPRLLWDNTAYIFGCYPEKAKKNDKDKEKARQVLFPAFRERHRAFRDATGLHDPGLDAVVAFLDSWNPDDIPADIREKIERFVDNFGTFAIQGKPGFVHETPAVMEAALRECLETDPKAPRGTCLITGKPDQPLVATVETKIKLPGTSVGGGAIATFNAPAYESYGKEQTYNSPLSAEAAFKAYNALNLLIADPRYHFKLANTTVVFWTARKTRTENLLAWICNPPSETAAASIDPVLSSEHAITRMAVATVAEAEKQGDDNRTMGRKYTLPYALYREQGFVNPFFADQSGFSEDDLAVFWDALVRMFDIDRSAARGLMATRKLVIFKHASKLGNAPAHVLFDAVKVARKPGIEFPRSFADYTVTIDRDSLPSGVEVIEI